MSQSQKSYRAKTLSEIQREMDELGGGINVKLSHQETIAILPSTIPFLREGRSPQKQHLTSKFIISTSGKEKEIKEFKFNEIVSTQQSHESWLLQERHFENWFFLGFNLSMLFFFANSQSSVYQTAINIIEKYPEYMKSIRISCVKFTPRSSDSFQTEDIDDQFGVHNNVTKFDEAEQLPAEIAIKYLTTLAEKEHLNSKSSKLSSTVIRFKYYKSTTQACELNLIQLFEELYTHPISTPQLFKYQTLFEKGLTSAISEVKSTQFLSTKDTLSHASLTKTRLLDYLSQVVFSTTKSIASIDLSKAQEGSSILKLLKTVNDFNSFSTVCHKFSSHATQLLDPTYNPSTRRFKGNDNYESLEDIQEKSTKRKDYQTAASSSLGRQLPDTTPFQESSKKSFKQEMKVLLDRLQQPKQQIESSPNDKKQQSIIKQSASTAKLSTNKAQITEPSLASDRVTNIPCNSKQYASKKNTFLIEETFKNEIEELKEELQLNKCNYEIEINEQRELIKNLQLKLTLLAEEKTLSELVRLYESELFRYSEGQKVLRAQIGYLAENKQQIQDQPKGKEIPFEIRKLKEIIASLNIEISNNEQEVNSLKRKYRESTFGRIQEERSKQKIRDLELQREELLLKNSELVTSLQNMGGIINTLKKDNQTLSQSINTLSQKIIDLEEDNQTLQTLAELSSKQRAPLNKLQAQKPAEKNQNKLFHVKSIDNVPAINSAINTLKNLTLKTGSGIPEGIFAQFSEEIHSEFEKINKSLQQYKKSHREIEEFLLNIIISLEQTYGKNEKTVRELNKFIRDFLFESISC